MYQWQDYSWTRRNLQIGGLILPLPKKRPFFSSRRSQFSSWTSFPPLLMNVSLTRVSGPRFKAQRDEIEQKIPERSSIPPYFSGFLSLSPQSGPGEARNYLGGIFFSPGLPSFPPSVATLGFHFVSIASLWWRKKIRIVYLSTKMTLSCIPRSSYTNMGNLKVSLTASLHCVSVDGTWNSSTSEHVEHLRSNQETWKWFGNVSFRPSKKKCVSEPRFRNQESFLSNTSAGLSSRTSLQQRR